MTWGIYALVGLLSGIVFVIPSMLAAKIMRQSAENWAVRAGTWLELIFISLTVAMNIKDWLMGFDLHLANWLGLRETRAVLGIAIIAACGIASCMAGKVSGSSAIWHCNGIFPPYRKTAYSCFYIGLVALGNYLSARFAGRLSRHDLPGNVAMHGTLHLPLTSPADSQPSDYAANG